MPPKGTKARYFSTGRTFAVPASELPEEDRRALARRGVEPRVFVTRDNVHEVMTKVSAEQRKKYMERGLITERYVPAEEVDAPHPVVAPAEEPEAEAS